MENPTQSPEATPKSRIVYFPTPEGLPRSMTPMPIVEGGIKISPDRIDIQPRSHSGVDWDTIDDVETFSAQAIRRMRVRE